VRIGDVAKQLNMPSSTIRYYEKRGLIPSPNEISQLIEQFTSNQSQSGICEQAVVSKRKEIKKQIAQLKQIDAVLGEMSECRCMSMEQCLNFALHK